MQSRFSLDSSARDLQRRLDSNRSEIYCTNQGHEESRKEQARLHEELAQRERALRETQIRSIHEVGDLKRAQEMRIDEFSRNELRKSHATIQELTSQTQDLQSRMNYMNDSTEFQDIESICSGKLAHVPRPAVVPSPRSLLSRDQSLRSDSWKLSGTQVNVFGNPRSMFFSSQTPCQGILHSLNQTATCGNHVQKSTGGLVAKSEDQFRGTLPMAELFQTESRRLYTHRSSNSTSALGALTSRHLERDFTPVGPSEHLCPKGDEWPTTRAQYNDKNKYRPCAPSTHVSIVAIWAQALGIHCVV